MTGKHGPADENLLQVIAAKERELESRVAQAKAEARRILDQAQVQAAAAREQARRTVAELEQRAQVEIARETELAAAQRLAAAQEEAQRVRSRASERMPHAMKLVVERVLSGLE